MSQSYCARYQTPALCGSPATLKSPLAKCNGSGKSNKLTLSTATLSQDIWRAVQKSSGTPKYASFRDEYEQPPPPPPSPVGASGWKMC
ncbi:hypothetical protein D8B26_002170 [Coccidioides posadasii str. Silveira]|uniref:uncharacterized protein n=1 Tax=Coccidioides posadasii (strain RMSCC 757 / Silveira) TaxID=443226 RepID=UPI001BEDF52F|nr:hypothetical protein D8B26_002170 [Coccidioides posadasii str. Silveira]